MEQGPSNESVPWTTVTANKRKSSQAAPPHAAPIKAKQATSKEEDAPRPSTKKARFIDDQVSVANPDTNKTKPPPIVIYNKTSKNTIEIISKISKEFTIKQVNSTKHLLHTDTLITYKAACDALKQNNIEFFTYTPREEKPISVLLKHLDGDFDPEVVLADLKSKPVQKVEFKNVKKFTTQRSIKEGRNLPIYIIQISHNSSINNLKSIKTVLHSIVTWEKLVKKDRIQCKRCQRIGHVALNCNLSYRCVKCDQPHNPGECPRSNLDSNSSDSKPYCINCKQFGHPASYRGCPKLKEIKQKIEDRKLKIQADREKKSKSFKNIIKPNISYSQITSNSKPETSPLQTSKITINSNDIPQTPHPSILEEI